ncbi:hypothetical protein [Paenibacillus sp. sgz500992]|uniref:8-oxoguanine DNA glycosylase n=1 Tax=Paenibacillus sp. sgz500992 TaxID=3242476 RepID=UPI0036D2AA98
MNDSSKPELILEQLWNTYGSSIVPELDIKVLSNDRLIEEFFFIVLGGYGITYEQNNSALEILTQKNLFNPHYYQNKDTLIQTTEKLRNELNTKQFGPLTKEGELRKYRFVNIKAKTLAYAGHWLWNECQWNIKLKLEELNSLNERTWLCTCPGVGLKSASWFLRNTGINYDYAVLDVHVIRFLKKIGFDIPDKITDTTYLHLEDLFRKKCKSIKVSLGSMDYLLWLLGRNGYIDYVR